MNSGQLCFSGQARLAQKSLSAKKYIFSTMNSGQLCLQGKHDLLKNPEC